MFLLATPCSTSARTGRAGTWRPCPDPSAPLPYFAGLATISAVATNRSYILISEACVGAWRNASGRGLSTKDGDTRRKACRVHSCRGPAYRAHFPSKTGPCRVHKSAETVRGRGPFSTVCAHGPGRFCRVRFPSPRHPYRVHKWTNNAHGSAGGCPKTAPRHTRPQPLAKTTFAPLVHFENGLRV